VLDHPLRERTDTRKRVVRFGAGEAALRHLAMIRCVVAAGQRELTWGDLDAVTLDAFGTLATLVDPVPALQEALLAQGVERSDDDVRRAFDEESAYYRLHAGETSDAASLAAFRAECARVFSEAIGAELDSETYNGAFRFEVAGDVVPALDSLRARGVRLAVIANWDFGLHEWLERLRIACFFDVVVAAARKPDPAALLEALANLRVEPARALHVGDEDADERAAHAAGMHFRPAPLARALETIA
jgi:HAD superfamily hydrolase (TIGR01509 family)